MDAFAISISHGLQYGVPLRAFVGAYTNMRFEPAGMTDDPDIRFASSIMDYLFRRLSLEYMTRDERAELGILSVDERMEQTLPGIEESVIETHQGHDLVPDPKSIPSAADLSDQMQAGLFDAPVEAPVAVTPPPAPAVAGAPKLISRPNADAPMCMQCGVQMVRAGSCHACPSCGSTSGCS
jgi:ribonucleoside-diphosphate reductase alpha chain